MKYRRQLHSKNSVHVKKQTNVSNPKSVVGPKTKKIIEYFNKPKFRTMIYYDPFYRKSYGHFENGLKLIMDKHPKTIHVKKQQDLKAKIATTTNTVVFCYTVMGLGLIKNLISIIRRHRKVYFILCLMPIDESDKTYLNYFKIFNRHPNVLPICDSFPIYIKHKIPYIAPLLNIKNIKKHVTLDESDVTYDLLIKLKYNSTRELKITMELFDNPKYENYNIVVISRMNNSITPKYPNFTIYNKNDYISETKYYDLIRRAKYVLLPYSYYSNRSSGFLLECLLFKKNIIIMNGSKITSYYNLIGLNPLKFKTTNDILNIINNQQQMNYSDKYTHYVQKYLTKPLKIIS